MDITGQVDDKALYAKFTCFVRASDKRTRALTAFRVLNRKCGFNW